MELSFKTDGLWFDASVEYDREDDFFEITKLTCGGQDASFLCDSETLNPMIYEAAWKAYKQACREWNNEYLIDRYEPEYV